MRNASLSEEPIFDITELLNADIVLTTYDVLKEDLTHDFDRHDGDRHRLRFQKRGETQRPWNFTHKFFKQIMWRSSKVHVADELQLHLKRNVSRGSNFLQLKNTSTVDSMKLV